MEMLTEEHEQLRHSVRRFLADRFPRSEVRRLAETDTGVDLGLWQEMARGPGLTGLHIPERFGGAGGGHVELGLVMEELGRSLAFTPYLPTVVMAGTALLRSDDQVAQERYLPAICDGQLLATVAVDVPPTPGADPIPRVTAQKTASGVRLYGSMPYVLDGATADLLIVWASSTEGDGLFLVGGRSPGLERTPVATLDRTRKQARVSFSDTPAERLGSADVSRRVLQDTLAVAVTAIAAEQTGGAQTCLDMAVEYAKTRTQFGRPIGSFQAIKHRCVDLMLELEAAKSAARFAAACADDDPAAFPLEASSAKAACSDAYFSIARESIQIHGGIGFTWDHPAHLYYRRAKSSELLLGNATYHREKVAELLGMGRTSGSGS
jgi:alkylation response protein AidB-like acyl-CoA dehydrogenase